MLPKLEEQLKAKNQEIENIVNAVQKGFAAQTLLQRLGELEKERDEIGEAIAKEKIKSSIFSQDHFKMALHNFRKIDVSKQGGKRKIIDTFINAIYVSDDDFKIVYNVNGKEETIKLEELESSTLFSNGAPNSRNPNLFGVWIFLFSHNKIDGLWFVEFFIFFGGEIRFIKIIIINKRVKRKPFIGFRFFFQKNIKNR